MNRYYCDFPSIGPLLLFINIYIYKWHGRKLSTFFPSRAIVLSLAFHSLILGHSSPYFALLSLEHIYPINIIITKPIAHNHTKDHNNRFRAYILMAKLSQRLDLFTFQFDIRFYLVTNSLRRSHTACTLYINEFLFSF